MPKCIDIEPFLEKYKDFPETTHSVAGCAINMILREIRNIQSVQPKPFYEWISVEDRLPELGDGDIAIVNCTGCAIMSDGTKKSLQLTYRRLVVRGKRVERWEWAGRICTWPITHWMPMPAPPEEETT